ncbi:MAG: 50S ribosomal protein L10 [Calditrichaeota bacterium]|nr:50S ribosomal protein L10 [Calditrichota bacterium]
MGEMEAKAGPAKKEALRKLEQRIAEVDAVVFADYRGLSVAETNELRGDFHKAGDGAQFLVVKNTILRMALENRGFRIEDDSLFIGPTAIGVGAEPVTPAKTLNEFAKKHEKLVFKGVLVDGEFYGAEKVKDFASMPTREQLLQGIVAGVAAPLTGFVQVLNETVRSFVGVLDAIIEKKKREEGGAD